MKYLIFIEKYNHKFDRTMAPTEPHYALLPSPNAIWDKEAEWRHLQPMLGAWRTEGQARDLGEQCKE